MPAADRRTAITRVSVEMLLLMTSSASHLPEDWLEEYAFGRLRRAPLARVEEHLLVCEQCRQRLVETEDFMRATRVAAWRLREIPLDITHDTRDGPIRLLARQAEDGAWEASLGGGELEEARRFPTVAEANDYLLECFREMFPEHRCTERCRATRVRRAGGGE